MELVSKEGISQTIGAFTGEISKFEDADINRVPFAGSWTAGEVAGHLLRSLKTSYTLLARNTQEADRPANKNVERITKFFGDYTSTLKNPEFTEPEKKQYKKAEILDDFQKIEKQLVEVTETMELNRICTGYELPTFGPFTRLEWITFFLTHIQRHTNQVQKISRVLKSDAYK
jgi:hypothetical protein